MEKPSFLLMKFFEKEQFANDFLSGELYANKLSYFRQLEDDQRADQQEGVFSLPIKDSATKVELTFREGDREIKYTENNISHLSIVPSEVSSLNVFCMHICQEIKYFPAGPNGAVVVQVAVPTRCIDSFGKFPVVILDRKEFIARYQRAAMSQCKAVGYGPVNYRDLDDRSSFFFHLALSKTPSFAYQREFRLVFYANDDDRPMCLNLGDLRDIVAVGDIVSDNSNAVNSTSHIIFNTNQLLTG